MGAGFGKTGEQGWGQWGRNVWKQSNTPWVQNQNEVWNSKTEQWGQWVSPPNPFKSLGGGMMTGKHQLRAIDDFWKSAPRWLLDSLGKTNQGIKNYQQIPLLNASGFQGKNEGFLQEMVGDRRLMSVEPRELFRHSTLAERARRSFSRLSGSQQDKMYQRLAAKDSAARGRVITGETESITTRVLPPGVVLTPGKGYTIGPKSGNNCIWTRTTPNSRGNGTCFGNKRYKETRE